MYLESIASAPIRAKTADGRSVSTKVVQLVVQDRTVMHVAQACADVLNVANRLNECRVYDWTIERADTIGKLGRSDILVLVGGSELPWWPSAKNLQPLTSAIRSATRICVVGAAVFLPLSARLLRDRNVAVHPNFRLAVSEEVHGPYIQNTATFHDRNLSSAIGLAAAIRMTVDVVREAEGDYTAHAIAEYLGLNDTAETSGTSLYWRYTQMAAGDPLVLNALSMMQEHLEDTLTVSQICWLMGKSTRVLERRLRFKLLNTPLRVYRNLRLEHARQLLSQTNMPLGTVALASGFTNTVLLKKWYLAEYGETPSQTRGLAFKGQQLT